MGRQNHNLPFVAIPSVERYTQKEAQIKVFPDLDKAPLQKHGSRKSRIQDTLVGVQYFQKVTSRKGYAIKHWGFQNGSKKCSRTSQCIFVFHLYAENLRNAYFPLPRMCLQLPRKLSYPRVVFEGRNVHALNIDGECSNTCQIGSCAYVIQI